MVLLLLPLLAGCHSILDPAPYDPSRTMPWGETASSPPGTVVPVVGAGSDGGLTSAEQRLVDWSQGYAGTRDSLMRQQMGLDVLILGTTAAAIINPLFDGARRSTLALTVGAGSLAAGRVYLGPQARWQAYHAGASALACGAGVAADYQALRVQYDPSAIGRRLASLLAEAEQAKAGATAVDAAALQGAIERASKARRDSEVARGQLETANLRLRSFARDVVRTVTDKALTGTMDYAAALAQLRALSGSGGASGSSAAPASAAGRIGARDRARTAAELVAELEVAAADANRFAAAMTEANTRLVGCAIRAS